LEFFAHLEHGGDDLDHCEEHDRDGRLRVWRGGDMEATVG